MRQGVAELRRGGVAKGRVIHKLAFVCEREPLLVTVWQKTGFRGPEAAQAKAGECIPVQNSVSSFS